MANPNIVSTSVIYGKTDFLSASTTATAITENAVDSGKILKINTLIVANTHGSAAVDVSVDIYRGSTAYYVAKTVSVPADATIVIIGKDNPLYLNEGDSLRVAASSANATAICSYEEIG